MFDELSYPGMIMGFVVLAASIFLGKWTLNPFLVHMGLITALFWRIATYVICFAAGYVMGVKMFD